MHNSCNQQLLVPKSAMQLPCPICFDTLEAGKTVEVLCGDRHKFCKDCLAHHIAVTAFPQCPQVACSYELTEADIFAACGQGEQLDAHRESLLQRAILGLQGRVTCPNI